MLKNVLGFHRIRVDDVMVPRADIVAVAAETTLGDLLAPVPHRRPFAPAGLRRDPRRPARAWSTSGTSSTSSPPAPTPAPRAAGATAEDGDAAAAEPRPGRPLDDPGRGQDPAAGPVRAALDAGGRPPGPHAGDAHPHGPRDRRIRRHRRPRLDRGPRRDGGRRHRGRARRRLGAHDRRGERRHLPRRCPGEPRRGHREPSASTSTTRTAPRTSTPSAASSSPLPGRVPSRGELIAGPGHARIRDPRRRSAPGEAPAHPPPRRGAAAAAALPRPPPQPPLPPPGKRRRRMTRLSCTGRAPSRPRSSSPSPRDGVRADDLVHIGGYGRISMLGLASLLKASAKLRAVHGSAGVETERLLQLEGVGPAVPRERNPEATHDLPDHPRPRGLCLVRVVEQLRAGRKLQGPHEGES